MTVHGLIGVFLEIAPNLFIGFFVLFIDSI